MLIVTLFCTSAPQVLMIQSYQNQPRCRGPKDGHNAFMFKHTYILDTCIIIIIENGIIIIIKLLTSSGTGMRGLLRMSTADRSFFTEIFTFLMKFVPTFLNLRMITSSTYIRSLYRLTFHISKYLNR